MLFPFIPYLKSLDYRVITTIFIFESFNYYKGTYVLKKVFDTI